MKIFKRRENKGVFCLNEKKCFENFGVYESIVFFLLNGMEKNKADNFGVHETIGIFYLNGLEKNLFENFGIQEIIGIFCLNRLEKKNRLKFLGCRMVKVNFLLNGKIHAWNSLGCEKVMECSEYFNFPALEKLDGICFCVQRIIDTG